MPHKASARRKLTKREQRELDVEIEFIEGVVHRDPTYVEALQVLGDDYTRRGRYHEGLKIDEQIAHLRPFDPTVLYNLACSYSLTGQSDLAVVALEKAINVGYTDFKWLSRDPDLANVRKHPGFAKIRAQAHSVKVKIK
jgi:tetratricopeptide (TPR) repeat protein